MNETNRMRKAANLTKVTITSTESCYKVKVKYNLFIKIMKINIGL